jgi:hypothetical protein
MPVATMRIGSSTIINAMLRAVRLQVVELVLTCTLGRVFIHASVARFHNKSLPEAFISPFNPFCKEL